MVKLLGEKEDILIGEDTFTPIASINTIVFNLQALTDSKNVGRIPPGLKTRKV